MRKIEQEMVNVILSSLEKDISWSKGNTRVGTWSFGQQRGIEVLLHNNIIARMFYKEDANGKGWEMKLTNAGWATRTTHSRLNAIIQGITGLSDRFTSKNSKNRTFSKIGYGSSWEKVS